MKHKGLLVIITNPIISATRTRPIGHLDQRPQRRHLFRSPKTTTTATSTTTMVGSNNKWPTAINMAILLYFIVLTWAFGNCEQFFRMHQYQEEPISVGGNREARSNIFEPPAAATVAPPRPPFHRSDTANKGVHVLIEISSAPEANSKSTGGELQLASVLALSSKVVHFENNDENNDNNNHDNKTKPSNGSDNLAQLFTMKKDNHHHQQAPIINNVNNETQRNNANTTKEQQIMLSATISDNDINNGDNTNAHTDKLVIQFPLYMRIIATIACIIIFTIGVTGNLLVPLVVIKTKDLRNSTNLFLINLSVADVLVLIVCMPTVLVELHSRPETWLLGEQMCK